MEFTQEKHKNFYIKKMYENITYDAYIFVSYENAKIKGWCCNAILFGVSFFLDTFYNQTIPIFITALGKSLLSSKVFPLFSFMGCSARVRTLHVL